MIGRSISLAVCLSAFLGSASSMAERNEASSALARAEASAPIASESLSRVQRWLHEVALPKIDPKTGLYLARGLWNYRDTAADCYPFLTWAAWAVDRDALNGPIRRILHDEQRLCNVLDRIPMPYDLEAQRPEELEYEDMVFQASEYVKDGLIAIVEVTGRDEWFLRMRAIEDDLWKHARIDTPFGKIPSENIEVNGEQIQALCRLYTMTGETKYLTWAERLADYYLSQENFVPNRLRDHGCEIIGGLGLLLGVESEHNPKKAKDYAPRIRTMLDTILESGRNDDGFMYNEIESRRFGKRSHRLSDGWGYNYVGYLCYDMAMSKNLYGPKVISTLDNLMKPAYKDYPWEGSIDGYADSIEGAIYLLNRVDSPTGLAWVNRETANNLVRPSELLENHDLWGAMKLQSNAVRTVIMQALMHTRATLAHPWRQDLQLGAAEDGNTLTLVVSADKAWEGLLEFDIPRHRLYMGFKKDWPRMNTLPEWFTVEPDKRYKVTANDAPLGAYTGAQLHGGLSVSVAAGETLRITVQPR